MKEHPSMVQQIEKPATTAGQPKQTAFTTFWLFQSTARRYEWSESERADVRQTVVDLILWAVSDDAAAFQKLAADLNRSPFGEALTLKHAYLGVASMSQYDPNHGPAFLKGIPPKQYLSVYPFTKTPEWFLLPYDQRRDLMVEHGT